MKSPRTKSGWTISYLSRRLHEEQDKLVEIESSSHPFKSEMAKGQRARIASVQHYLSQPA